MKIYDDSSPRVIPANAIVVSKTANTVVMSISATGAGVGSGASIGFTYSTGPNPDRVSMLPTILSRKPHALHQLTTIFPPFRSLKKGPVCPPS
jgi:hypothetical protein